MLKIVENHLAITQRKVNSLKVGKSISEKLKNIQLNHEKVRLTFEKDHKELIDLLNKNYSTDIEKFGVDKIEKYMKTEYIKVLQSFVFLK